MITYPYFKQSNQVKEPSPVANIKSAKKRIKTTERNRVRNHAAKSAIRTAVKRVLEGVSTKESAVNLTETANKAFSLVDKAILKGILHKNTGARIKSRVARVTQTVA
jgi:small subunit ribosomal protein S20